jgi:hypothetical protein
MQSAYAQIFVEPRESAGRAGRLDALVRSILGVAQRADAVGEHGRRLGEIEPALVELADVGENHGAVTTLVGDVTVKLATQDRVVQVVETVAGQGRSRFGGEYDSVVRSSLGLTLS